MQSKSSLSTQAARNLATTTKTVPITEEISPRWLLGLLPWVSVDSGTYRVNRRKIIIKDNRKLEIEEKDGEIIINPDQLRAIPLFKYADSELIEDISAKLLNERYDTGETVVSEGEDGNKFFIIARGTVEVITTDNRGNEVRLSILGEGDFFGEIALIENVKRTATIKALSSCIFMTLQSSQFNELMAKAPQVKESLLKVIRERRNVESEANEYGESKIEVLSGHNEQTELPKTFVDYSNEPVEYSLSTVQTILKVNTRVSDLYNNPMNQLKEQMRLTIETMKERQEWEIINNKEFGLINAVAASMIVKPKYGAPTPEDMDELLAKVWKAPSFFLAHPKAIAAFGRECTKKGIPLNTALFHGVPVVKWREIPIIPCDKMLINGKSKGSSYNGTTDILLMRVGEKEQGVVGLHQPQIEGAVSPSLTAKFAGIDDLAIASYLLTLYFSAAVLTEDAIAKLENVEVGYY